MTEEVKETRSLDELAILFKDGWTIQLIRKSQIPIPKITWQEKNGGFSWAFATNKDGSAIPEYKDFIEALQKDSIEQDNFKYSLSKDGRFLQRTKLDNKK